MILVLIMLIVFSKHFLQVAIVCVYVHAFPRHRADTSWQNCPNAQAHLAFICDKYQNFTSWHHMREFFLQPHLGLNNIQVKKSSPCFNKMLKLIYSSYRYCHVDVVKHLQVFYHSQLSRAMRKPMFWFPTRSDTNQAVQLQKMARGLKFRI